MGSALHGGRLAPWQRKVITGFVIGALVVTVVSVVLVAFG